MIIARQKATLLHVDADGRSKAGVTVSEKIEFALRTILIGVGATMVMDIWALLLRQFGIPSLNFALLGRWIGHLPQDTHTVYGFGLYLATLATALLIPAGK